MTDHSALIERLEGFCSAEQTDRPWVADELWGRIDYDQDGWDAFSLDLADGWLPLPSAPNQAKEAD